MDLRRLLSISVASMKLFLFWFGLEECVEKEEVFYHEFSLKAEKCRAVILHVCVVSNITISRECARNISPQVPPRAAESEMLDVWPTNLCFNKPSR